jgi:hypothetical protein
VLPDAAAAGVRQAVPRRRERSKRAKVPRRANGVDETASVPRLCGSYSATGRCKTRGTKSGTGDLPRLITQICTGDILAICRRFVPNFRWIVSLPVNFAPIAAAGW